MNDPIVSMGKISYINASPVYYGLDHGLCPAWLKMVTDVPAVLNQQVLSGQIKVSPISAAFYAMHHKDLMLIPDLSISCHDHVMSVILASHVPLESLEGKRIILSPESVTGASFFKMILKMKNVSPVFETDPVDDCQYVAKNADAAMVIGDSALKLPWDDVFSHRYDLGHVWYEMTGQPFVFAVWVVHRDFARQRPDLVQKIHALLLASRKQGYDHIDTVIKAGQKKLGLDRGIISKYYDLLHCDLDDEKTKAMDLFFDSLFKQGVIPEKADIEFFKANT